VEQGTIEGSTYQEEHMTSNRKIVRIAALALLLVLSAAAAAWACTPQTRLFAPEIPKGPSGTQVTIKGDGAPAGTPVTIEWGALKGAKRAETTADSTGAFSAAIEVPQTSPGIYFIVATPGSGEAAVARQVYQVTGPGADTTGTASDLWRGFSPTGQLAPDAAMPRPVQTDAALAGAGLVGMATLGALSVMFAAVRRRQRSTV